MIMFDLSVIYTGRKLSASLSYVTVREEKMERSRGSKTIASPPSPYLGWLATNVCM
jgi:hypothetical protein